MNFFSELAKRWALESPDLFKKIQNIGVILVAIAAFVAGIPVALEQFPLVKVNLDFLYTVAQYIGALGAVMAAMSKLPVKNPEELK